MTKARALLGKDLRAVGFLRRNTNTASGEIIGPSFTGRSLRLFESETDDAYLQRPM